VIKKNIYKFIKILFILFCSALSLSSIVIIYLSIFILANKSITINDNSLLLSKLASWYINHKIEFKQIRLENISFSENYIIKVKNMKLKKFNTYSHINIDNLDINMTIGNILSKAFKFNTIDINGASLTYNYNNDKGNSSILINDILRRTHVLNIQNSSLNIKYNNNEHYFSSINITKEGKDNINMLGSFKYKDNYLQKIEKDFSFKSINYNGIDLISLNFNNLNINNNLINIFFNNNDYYLAGSVSGVANIIFKDALMSSIDIDIFSNNINFSILNNFKFNDISIIKIPAIKNLSVKASYSFNDEIISVSELNIDIKNSNDLESNITLFSEYKPRGNSGNVKLIYTNININEFIYIPEFKYALSLINNISGRLSFYVKNQNLQALNISIKDVFEEDLMIKNIDYEYNKHSNINEIKFIVITNYNLINNYLKNHAEFYNINTSFIDSNSVTSFNVNLDLTNLGNSFNKLKGSIDGNIKFDKGIYIYSDILIANSINYKVVFSENKITAMGIAYTNGSDINFNIDKTVNRKLNINLDIILKNEIFKKVYFIEDYVGDSLLACSIDYNNTFNYYCKLDLIHASFSLPYLSYYKENKSKAELLVGGTFDEYLNFSKVDIEYLNLENSFIGEIYLDKLNYDFFIKFSEFKYNYNEIKFDIASNDKLFKLDIHSGLLDLDIFLNKNFDNNLSKDIIINAYLEKILIKQFALDNAMIFYKKNNSSEELDIKAKYFSDEDIIFNLTNSNDVDYFSYVFNASNAGKFFKLLKFNSEVQDGILSSEGYIGNLDNDNEIMGTLSIDDFKIMKAPIFAELLLAASLTGLIDVLNNNGIDFEQFDAQFTGKENIYNITKSRAYGLSLGLTGKGIINNNNNSLDIEGSIIPAYKINSLFNNIPVIGELLAGEEDEGIFAITYEAKGVWNKIDININPFALLTPGIIRNIFN
jgi:hypothetical protein